MHPGFEQFQNRIRYTGQQYDELTGQYYLRARYYNPVLGRFMQEDAYQGDGLNLYAYCHNNPVTYYDPSGYARKKHYSVQIHRMQTLQVQILPLKIVEVLAEKVGAEIKIGEMM